MTAFQSSTSRQRPPRVSCFVRRMASGIIKRRVIVLATTLALAVSLTVASVLMLWERSTPQAMVGVWKGTDEFRHEHFFEFHDDGTLTWWDRDRAHDGTFSTRGPFKGYYKLKDRHTVVAETGGFL